MTLQYYEVLTKESDFKSTFSKTQTYTLEKNSICTYVLKKNDTLSMGRAICTPITFLKNLVSAYTPYKYKLLF